MKVRKIIILLIIVVLFFGLMFFVDNNDGDEIFAEDKNIYQIDKEIEDRKFSRITFFNLNKEMRSSLAIPEDWEGRYRVKESGNKITFSYVVDPVVSYEIFSLRYVPREDWNSNEIGSTEIIEKEKNIVYYVLGDNINISQELKNDLQLMRNDIEEIVDSFK